MFVRRLLLPLLLPTFVLAQEDAHKLKIDARKPIRIDYLAPSWNKDPDKAENSALLLRDAVSGRLVKVEMTESKPNSSYFVGIYQINFADQSQEITPEVYVAPMAMLKSDPQNKRIESLIQEGLLLRKPYFLRTERNMQTLSVFDSRAQAIESFQSFQKTGMGRPLIDPAAFDAQRVAQKEAEEKMRQQLALQAEQARAKLEEEERRKQEELKKQQAALSEAEKARRKKQAVELAAQAMDLYKAEKYKDAEEKFTKSLELDPDNTVYAFQYGVTLYRNEQYNRAIVALKMASGEGVNVNERDYYIALSHMRLKEYDQSRNLFKELQGRNDKVLSPSAAFFAGVIDFQKENYDVAKTEFEYVLDNSSDSKMDQQAETYIDQIANIKQFEEMRKKKLILSANLGLMYDSNILSVSAANAPTDLAGYRWAYGGSLEFRPVFSEKHEFSAILSLSDMYSMDTGFKAKSEFQNTDPMVTNLSLPYKWKGIALGTPAQLGLTPAYEIINMNADGDGAREAIINSSIVKMDGTFVMSDDHFANYSLEARNDKSLLTPATDADDQTANKVTLATTQTYFRDKKKTRAMIGDLGIATNMANGDNQSYNRIDLAGSYMTPSFWETTFVSRLALGYANYSKHLTGRTDTTYGLTLVWQKQLSETFGWNFMGSYSKNSSTLDEDNYDKFMVMTGLNWKAAF